MEDIDKALQELKLYDNPNISSVAKQYNVNRSTLSRRYNGVATSKAVKHQNQQFLSPPQERRLVRYINELTKRHTFPTPTMVSNFAHDIARKRPSKNWSHRFCKRWSSQLDTRYLRAMDYSRHKADSKQSYELYFELLKEKIHQYEILPQNTYNMDEKGFMIGVMGKSKRIFSKATFKRDKKLTNLQDGSREWITVIATICADHTWLPPALIYGGQQDSLQDSWLQDLDVKKHNTFFQASPSGWTNDELAFAWMSTIFERYSKPKAGRDWRLLIVDGHGSHINMQFLQYCQDHRILVAVFPPHATHRLQPLDVSLFSPLATYYTQELDRFITNSAGISRVTKRDFFRLFWPTFSKAFTQSNIASGWRKTGLYPFEPAAVLDTLKSPDSSRPGTADSSHSSTISMSNIRASQRLMKEVRQELPRLDSTTANKVNKLTTTFLDVTTQLALLQQENLGLHNALYQEKKKRKRNKTLVEQFRAEEGGGAVFYSPMKIDRLKQYQVTKERDKEVQKQAKELANQVNKRKAAARKAALEDRKLQRLIQQQERKDTLAQKASDKRHQKDDLLAKEQLAQSLQSSAKKPKTLHQKLIHLQEAAPPSNSLSTADRPIQAISTRTRTIRRPVRLDD